MTADDDRRPDEAAVEERLRAALAPTDVAPTEARVADLRKLVERARDEAAHETADAATAAASTVLEDPTSPGRHGGTVRRRPDRRTLFGLAAGAALAVGGGVVGATVQRGRDGEDLLARGTPEFTATLTGEGVEVRLDGDVAPEGRIVTLRSDTLPSIPAGTFYELWFLPDEGARISAGTFHPDEEGRTLVVLHAAVDPSVVTEVEVTLVDGTTPDGPGEVVATGRVTPR